MTQKEKIEKDYIIALKEKNVVAKNLLSVVKGEIQNVEKNIGQVNLSDEEVNKILTKVSKSVNETISGLNSSSNYSPDLLVSAVAEFTIIQKYLPRQMSREEVVQKVTELSNSGVKNIGSIMKEFSTLSVDRKLVSEIIKEIIK